MPSSIGAQLSHNNLITGFGRLSIAQKHRKPKVHTTTAIKGIERVAKTAISKIEHAAIHGGSYKLAGMGTRKPRKPRSTLTKAKK